jgi:hypothetical protein
MTLRLTNFLILAAVFCFGVATLALLPPFEAFDEAEYWSVIQDDADTGVLPRLSEARVSQDAVAYPGPLPASSGQPYAAYFAKKSAALAGPTRFVPSDVPNYEAQHPPLFFVLMRPVYRAAAGLNWPEHFFVLRLVNWIIAFAGFAIGALATQGVLRRRGASALWVPLAWPLMFPQFFEEFARVTNDTLCLLIMGLVWWLLMTPGKWRGVGIGTLLGAGLLTKAFFLPVTLGVVALLAVVAWRQAVVVAVIAAALGGWWYVQAALSTGHVTGASDFIQARVHFSWDMPGLYLAGIFRMLLGFCWAGSWSFVHPARVLFLPVILLFLLPYVFYARLVGRDLVALAPVFVVAPVLAGLLYHLAVMVASTGIGGGTPGWFFHIFAGPLSLVLALGWRRFCWPLVVYAGILDVALAWMQAEFFSGCLPRVGQGAVDVLAATCVMDVDRLRFLTFPDVALVTFGLGLAALIGTVTFVKRRGWSGQARP